jgi:hypothetical protein
MNATITKRAQQDGKLDWGYLTLRPPLVVDCWPGAFTVYRSLYGAAFMEGCSTPQLRHASGISD